MENKHNCDSDDEGSDDDPELEEDDTNGTATGRAGERSSGGAAGMDAQRIAAIEGVNSEIRKFTDGGVRHFMRWCPTRNKYHDPHTPPEWKPWGKVAENVDEHLQLRKEWLAWMACTSKVLQTVDNEHLNRHLDYMHSGPTINFVDLQDTPSTGRRLQALGHLVECINNFGEFAADCVVPTPETEIVFGQGKASKTVQGMRMKNDVHVPRREEASVSPEDAGNKWLKSFRRGTPRNPGPSTLNPKP